ncbi:transposase [Alicycliphilus denitrificans]|uniref:transposase n=1 Tax=Alicycliphilus denitrificans TaxID=179636 RepID=UPI00384F79F0
MDTPTESGETRITLWSSLPEAVTPAQIAQLYSKRWRIEGMFGHLMAVLNSKNRNLGHHWAT